MCDREYESPLRFFAAPGGGYHASDDATAQWVCDFDGLETLLNNCDRDGRLRIPSLDAVVTAATAVGRTVVIDPAEPDDGRAEPPAARGSMTFAEFSRMNRARCESPNGFDHTLDSWSLSDWFTAAMGELGEAANVAKKLNRVRDGIPGNRETEAQLLAKLKSEIGDTVIYLDLLAQRAGFVLGEAAVDSFEAKSREIGYTPERELTGARRPPPAH